METKEYTTDQEQLARFAKAMGHPARIAILNFLAKQNCCFFGDIHEVLPISVSYTHLDVYKRQGHDSPTLRVQLASGQNRV